MTTSIQKTLQILACIAALGLSGCLSSSESSPEQQSPNPNPNPNPPPPTNTAPTISGNPPLSVQLGDEYSFTPQASDADGDPLTFSIENQPSWASFDTNSGQLSGVPTLGDVGQYANIRISVSDGQASADMAAFAVDVTQVGTFSATLSWSAPTLNEDGTPLTDLAGYKLYYGTSSGNYTNEIRIDNPSVMTYTVQDLSAGTYYFAATAFNAADVESRYSGEAVKILN